MMHLKIILLYIIIYYSSIYTKHTHAGVYLSLGGLFYPNNSEIPITLIGVDNDALKCTTDRVPCCRQVNMIVGSINMGIWVSPTRNVVPENGPFYTSSGVNDGTVNLNRLNNNTAEPLGLFYCMVPDARGVNQTLFANIGEIMTITI